MTSRQPGAPGSVHTSSPGQVSRASRGSIAGPVILEAPDAPCAYAGGPGHLATKPRLEDVVIAAPVLRPPWDIRFLKYSRVRIKKKKIRIIRSKGASESRPLRVTAESSVCHFFQVLLLGLVSSRTKCAGICCSVLFGLIREFDVYFSLSLAPARKAKAGVRRESRVWKEKQSFRRKEKEKKKKETNEHAHAQTIQNESGGPIVQNLLLQIKHFWTGAESPPASSPPPGEQSESRAGLLLKAERTRGARVRGGRGTATRGALAGSPACDLRPS